MRTTQTFTTGRAELGKFYSLPALQAQGYPNLHRLPISIRIILESLIRNCDELKVTTQDVANLANWQAKSPGDYEVPFTVSRILLQDFTGVPLLVDLAAMRDAVANLGLDPKIVEPLVPVDLVIDHSVQVDWAGTPDALNKNLDLEFSRNAERYEFLKWGQQAFHTFSVTPPSIGIVHQVNLEHLAPGIHARDGIYFPDSLVGTDSHTTMVNGLGVVAWGVGGIEAEAGMLGQPVTFLVPEVIGVHLTGTLNEGITATDLALRVTELLRTYGVVGKFVEFFGEGAASLSLPHRATVANMAPEYGATMGFFPIDEQCVAYLSQSGRKEEDIITYKNYFTAQELWGMPKQDDIDYSAVLHLNLCDIVPSVSGPRRPQDRVNLCDIRQGFHHSLSQPTAEGGFGKSIPTTVNVLLNSPAGTPEPMTGYAKEVCLSDGAVVIAAITSCTNTSNPELMLCAGILAKKAVALGLSVPPHVKTSLAPGSRIADTYFAANKLVEPLNQLGFHTVGYGCTTCIGNSGPLNPAIESAIAQNNLAVASVLSGNRNFEARVHASVKANYLMSPPLVVAFALAGRVDIDFSTDPLGYSSSGSPVLLADIWPTAQELTAAMQHATTPGAYTDAYAHHQHDSRWQSVHAPQGATFAWNPDSTYIQSPPFFDAFQPHQKNDISPIIDARALCIFGDSVTTDHISPAGAIKETGPAGAYLSEHRIPTTDFNSFGSRRGNDRIMSRGTFANVRIKNRLIAGAEGGYTLYFGTRSVPAPDKPIATSTAGTPTFIFEAAQAYAQDTTPLIIIAGDDYGMGSSRDWAAKGTRLLGVKAVIAKSFERIHRSNLIGMGVIPLTFANPADYDAVAGLQDASFCILGIDDDSAPRSSATLQVIPHGEVPFSLPIILRIDTPIEKEYYRAGGILPYVLNQIIS